MLITRLLSLLGQLAFGFRGTSGGAPPYTVAGHDTRVMVVAQPRAKVTMVSPTGYGVRVVADPRAKVESI